jgi:hypothetical protein
MTDARTVPRVLVAALLMAVLALATSVMAGPRSAAAPADALDWPERLSVGPANDVAIDMQTDGLGAMVVRVAPDGGLLARWANDGPAIDIAAGVDGMIYTVMYKSNRVYKYAPDGTRLAMWQERNPLAVAAGPYGEAAGGAVYVLAWEQGIGEPPRGPPEVTRYTAEGRQLGRWAAAANAYDLVVVPTDGAPDGTVAIAEGDPLGGGTSVLARFALDGTLLGRSPLTAAAIGLGANADGDVYTVLKQKDTAAGFISAYRDGQPTGTGWRLPAGEPKDLAVDPTSGDVYVIVDDYILRYAGQGTLLGRITREQLNGLGGTATPGTPTPPTPATAVPTPTIPATVTGMPTPATAAPTSTPPGATVPPTAPRPAYLPLGARDARL